MNASYSLAKFLILNAGIENILEKLYRPYSSGITAAGRNIVAAIRVKL